MKRGNAESPGLTILHPHPSSQISQITDFGLVKLQDGSDPRARRCTGNAQPWPRTNHWQAWRPTAAVDVYGLCAILYEALRRAAVRGGDPALTVCRFSMRSHPLDCCSRPFLLTRHDLSCLRKEPERRYAAQELADDLSRFRNGHPILARPVRPLERIVRLSRRKPLVTALAAALVFVVLGSLADALWRWRQTAAALAQSELAHGETKAHLYLSQIARAYHELLTNRVSRAERILEETPVLSRGWEWNYLKRQCQTSLFTMRGSGGAVHAVAYSPDGKLLASGSGDWYTGEDGELILWTPGKAAGAHSQTI